MLLVPSRSVENSSAYLHRALIVVNGELSVGSGKNSLVHDAILGQGVMW